jgi:hypothetical protein
VAKLELEVWGEEVLLELRDIPTGGLVLLGKNAKAVFIAKLGSGVPSEYFEIGDEVKIHNDAKVLANSEGEYEYCIMRTYRDIACKVKRSLIDV